jgi:hypothetical protein
MDKKKNYWYLRGSNDSAVSVQSRNTGVESKNRLGRSQFEVLLGENEVARSMEERRFSKIRSPSCRDTVGPFLAAPSTPRHRPPTQVCRAPPENPAGNASDWPATFIFQRGIISYVVSRLSGEENSQPFTPNHNASRPASTTRPDNMHLRNNYLTTGRPWRSRRTGVTSCGDPVPSLRAPPPPDRLSPSRDQWQALIWAIGCRCRSGCRLAPARSAVLQAHRWLSRFQTFTR